MTAESELSAALAERYEILSEVGRGGFATVYAARDLRHGSKVAIKVLHRDLVAALGGLRFSREVQILAGLQHPNILPVLDSGDAAGIPYYVMPFVEGETLAQRLRRDACLPVEEAVRLSADVADGLAYAHAQGFVHRDIKPDNILLSHGHAVLADFGVAHAVDVAGMDSLTASGVALGTVSYMSPEQASGERVDGRADIYSLACVLYETLAGVQPFTGPSTQAIMARHALDTAPSIRTVRQAVPEALESVVKRAMAKVPTDRFATAAEFRDAILAAVTAPATASTTAERQSASPAPRRWLVAAAGIALAATAAVVAWRATADRRAALDPNRVMVFPLVLPADWHGASSTGEDVATMIGSAMDGAGALRWIDGWQLLNAEQRDDIRSVTNAEQQAIARRQRSGYTLTGRVAQRGDSADVFLELRDVAGDSLVARPRATASLAAPWRAGLAATTQLLPKLIRTGVPDVASEWTARAPATVAHFLRGESAFRRVQLDAAEDEFAQAVALDSTFGLAAIRGAQAATWNHHSQGASTLIATALRSRLSPRHRAFAEGYEAFLRGRADSAVAGFRRALAMDSASAFVWAQLGEVYAHLLPVAGNTDSLVADALGRAVALDSTARQPLFHLIEVRLRQGDTTRAAPLLARFLSAGPDTTLAREVEIMDACVRKGATGIEWESLARTRPAPLVIAAAHLGAGGRRWACSLAAFDALLRIDTLPDDRSDGRRWASLLGSQAIALGRGDTLTARRAIERFAARWHMGGSLFLLDQVALGVFPQVGDSVARVDAQAYGDDFGRCAVPYRCWLLGMHMVRAGDAAHASQAARHLLASAAGAGARGDSLMARSLDAHIALQGGDTALAIAQYRSLLASPRLPPEIEWDEALPMAAERMALSRVMLARREFREALDVLEVFDARASVHLLYLPESLRLRAAAADSLGEAAKAATFRTRLSALASP